MVTIGKEDIEKSYLGSLLISESKELKGISEDNFFYPNNKKIFNAIKSIIEDGVTADLVLIKNKLEESGDFKEIGIEYLVSLTNEMYDSTKLDYYSALLKKESKKVELLKIGSELSLLSQGDSSSENLFNIASKLISLSASDSAQYNLSRDIENTMEYIETRRGKTLLGFDSGVPLINNYCGGLQKRRTYRIGAPSNVGKTWLLYNIIISLLKQNIKVAVFTLENDKEFTLSNLMANYLGVNPKRLFDEGYNIDDALQFFEDKKQYLTIIDNRHEIGDIFSTIVDIKPEVVMVDFIGLATVKGYNEEAKFTEYALRVQQFVKRQSVCWIDLSNLPKNAESSDMIKLGGGFMGSSALKNVTDVGIHMRFNQNFFDWKQAKLEERDLDFKLKDNLINTSVITLRITKNRLGVGNIEENYLRNFNQGATYKELTDEEKFSYGL